MFFIIASNTPGYGPISKIELCVWGGYCLENFVNQIVKINPSIFRNICSIIIHWNYLSIRHFFCTPSQNTCESIVVPVLPLGSAHHFVYYSVNIAAKFFPCRFYSPCDCFKFTFWHTSHNVCYINQLKTCFFASGFSYYH